MTLVMMGCVDSAVVTTFVLWAEVRISSLALSLPARDTAVSSRLLFAYLASRVLNLCWFRDVHCLPRLPGQDSASLAASRPEEFNTIVAAGRRCYPSCFARY